MARSATCCRFPSPLRKSRAWRASASSSRARGRRTCTTSTRIAGRTSAGREDADRGRLGNDGSRARRFGPAAFGRRRTRGGTPRKGGHREKPHPRRPGRPPRGDARARPAASHRVPRNLRDDREGRLRRGDRPAHRRGWSWLRDERGRDRRPARRGRERDRHRLHARSLGGTRLARGRRSLRLRRRRRVFDLARRGLRAGLRGRTAHGAGLFVRLLLRPAGALLLRRPVLLLVLARRLRLLVLAVVLRVLVPPRLLVVLLVPVQLVQLLVLLLSHLLRPGLLDRPWLHRAAGLRPDGVGRRSALA